MNIGLFFGSFNPIHIGHLIIANHLVENDNNIDNVWFVVTPQNPFKDSKSLLDDNDRLELAQLATRDYEKFGICDVEFKLEKPSYTYNSLRELRKLYPEHNFSIIMGMDNIAHFNTWEYYEEMLEHHAVFVYPRILDEKIIIPKEFKNNKQIHFIEAPIIEISATMIRAMIKDGKNIHPLVSAEVAEKIESSKYYK